MNQKGVINIVVVIGAIIVFATAGFLFSAHRALSPVLEVDTVMIGTTTVSGKIPEPQSTKKVSPPAAKNTVSVEELLANKEAYFGKSVRVEGKIAVNIFYSSIPCFADVPCDTNMGAQLELRSLKSPSVSGGILLLFKNGKPSYKDGEVMTIDGIWSKDQVPAMSVGSSSNNPDTPVKREDRYFLSIETQNVSVVSTANESACKQAGGRWAPQMNVEAPWICVMPVSDEGEMCTDSSECDTYCQAPKGTKPGAKVVGQCAPSRLDCSQEVKNGVAEFEACQ